MPLILVVVMFLTACATPEVETSSNGFNEERYQFDLNNCRGGSLIVASAENFKNVAIGSLWGAVQGLPHGARVGDGWEVAAIGAVVGATIGLGTGAKDAIQKHDDELAQCLRAKGYVPRVG